MNPTSTLVCAVALSGLVGAAVSLALAPAPPAAAARAGVAPDALNYLLTNGSVFDRGLTDDQEPARPPLSPLKDAPAPAR